MNSNLLFLAFALSTAAWSAQVTFVPAPNGTSVDLVIGGLGGAQVGAYDLSIDYDPNLIGISAAASLGSLGIPGVETFWQSQSSAISPSIQRLELIEVSLLLSQDLLALQPGTFGLARLSLQWHASGTALFSASGIVSNAVGDPINTTFTTGQVSNVPEPGTLSLLGVAVILLFGHRSRRTRERMNGCPRDVVTRDQRRSVYRPLQIVDRRA